MSNLMYCFCFFLLTVGYFSCKNSTGRFISLDSKITGIEFENTIFENDSFNILENEYIYNGGGVGIFDLNKDGLQDIILTGNMVSTKIYLNKGGFVFIDVSHTFKGLDNNHWISGVSIADVNNDGFDDVYFTCTNHKNSVKRKNQLWINQGHKVGDIPTFINLADEYGVADTSYSVHSAFFDYDLDGDLDLYVLNNIINKDIPTNYRQKIINGTAINNDKLYRNNGNNSFTEVSKEAGINIEGFGLGIAVSDLNKDQYPDLYISNDYLSNDILYINQKDGTFKNIISDVISYQSKFSMGNDICDVNDDGYTDIMTTDMMPESYSRKKQTINGSSYNVYVNDEKYDYQYQYVRNMLHMNNGIINSNLNSFSEIGQAAGIYQTEWSWSPLFADFDNDGDKDLIITNGFPKDLTDKDFTNYKAQFYGYLIGNEELLTKIPVVKIPNYAFENLGHARFRNVTSQWGMGIPSFSNGASFCDLDNDGDLDYVVNNINSKAFIYKNMTIENSKSNTSNFIKIKLNGLGGNTNALGSKIELWSKDQYTYYEHFLTRGYLSSVDPIVHIGLGKNTMIDSIKVTWPYSDSITLLSNIQVNQLIQVFSNGKSNRFISSESQNQLLTLDSTLINYRHNQRDYVDFFQSQSIIHQKFSNVGPLIVKGDLNNDQMEDILISGCSDSPTAAFVYDGRSYVNTEFSGLTGIKKALQSGIEIADINGDHLNDVVAISGGYSNEDINDYVHGIYLNKGINFDYVPLPIPPFVASVTKIFDFNKDGLPDIFIGRRVDRLQFPKSSESYLLINSNEGFKENNVMPLALGMVIDASVTDLDNDGWLDLVVARSWNSLYFLKNKNGDSLSPLFIPETESKKGYWQSITNIDLDNDGYQDFIVGNLGDNHRFTVSKEYPLKLYELDIDQNGSIDPIYAAYWKNDKGVMEEYPVNYLDEFANQSAFFRKKFTSYFQFSKTNMNELLQGVAYDKNKVHHINDCSSYILWNEKGKNFTWQKLPTEVQWSTINKTLPIDINNDSFKDLIIVGNNYGFDVSTGHYASNKGIVLINLGDRKFEYVPNYKSGLNLIGQCESMILLEKPKKIIFFGLNRKNGLAYSFN